MTDHCHAAEATRATCERLTADMPEIRCPCRPCPSCPFAGCDCPFQTTATEEATDA